MLKLAAAVVLSLGFFQPGVSMTGPTSSPSITIDPIPPKAGSTATVTYDGPLPANVTITFDPSSDEPLQLKIESPGGVTVSIPADAETMKVTDDSGAADAESTHVEP